MTKKYKYLLVFFTITVLLFLGIVPSYALEVKDYPRLPGVPSITANCSPTDCLPNYVSYFFGLGIYLAGVIAVISLAIGGVQLIFSSMNPESRNNALDRIKSAILGLVLTLSSLIILNTINPVLTVPTLTPLGQAVGIFYSNGREEKPAPTAESDTSLIPAGFGKIIYKCPSSGTAAGPVLIVQKFPEKNFGGYKNATVERINCGGSTAVDKPSFKMSFETPGVYYFLGAGCKGYMSGANFSDVQEIEEPFRSEAKSVLVINDIQNNINYGVILHREINFRGDCSLPLESYQKERNCMDTAPPSSANIFTFNRNNPETSGNGLVFYSKPFGYKTGANAGYFELPPKTIKEIWQGKPSVIDFSNSYNFVDVPEEEKKLCKNFENCPGSVKIQGNYLAVLYAKQLQSQSPYCQVFDKDIPNIKEEEVAAVQGRKLDLIYVIPIK